MGSGIDLMVDYAFKRTFGSRENRNVLKHLLNSILKVSLQSPITEISILNPFSQRDRSTRKATVFDIKARDESGREFIVEVQLFAHTNFPERLLFYGAREYSSQLSEGDSYAELKPVFVVCFTAAILFRTGPQFHSRFRLVDTDQCIVLTDHFEVHVIELPKFAKRLSELRDDEERWIYFLRHSQDFDDRSLPETLAAITEIKQATGTLTMVSQSPKDRERYEASLKAWRDEDARRRFAVETAFEDGRITGMNEGELREARRTVLQLGELRFGAPTKTLRLKLERITDLETLRGIVPRVLECRSWTELLKHDVPAGRN